MANGKKEAEEGAKAEKHEEKKEAKGSEAKEIDEVKDRLLRLAAEFDNYKKQAAKDMDGAKSMGKVELIKKLLPTLDEFELALYAMGNAASDKEHARGVELVFSNISDALRSAGLKEIEAKGKYDPYKHEIVMIRESGEAEGTILEVVRKGYSFNGMMLRPASVIVSKGKENEKEVGTK